MKISVVGLHVVAIKTFNHSVRYLKKPKQTQVYDLSCFQKMHAVREYMIYSVSLNMLERITTSVTVCLTQALWVIRCQAPAQPGGPAATAPRPACCSEPPPEPPGPSAESCCSVCASKKRQFPSRRKHNAPVPCFPFTLYTKPFSSTLSNADTVSNTCGSPLLRKHSACSLHTYFEEGKTDLKADSSSSQALSVTALVPNPHTLPRFRGPHAARAPRVMLSHPHLWPHRGPAVPRQSHSSLKTYFLLTEILT